MFIFNNEKTEQAFKCFSYVLTSRSKIVKLKSKKILNKTITMKEMHLINKVKKQAFKNFKNYYYKNYNKKKINYFSYDERLINMYNNNNFILYQYDKKHAYLSVYKDLNLIDLNLFKEIQKVYKKNKVSALRIIGSVATTKMLVKVENNKIESVERIKDETGALIWNLVEFTLSQVMQRLEYCYNQNFVFRFVDEIIFNEKIEELENSDDFRSKAVMIKDFMLVDAKTGIIKDFSSLLKPRLNFLQVNNQ